MDIAKIEADALQWLSNVKISWFEETRDFHGVRFQGTPRIRL